MQTTRRALGLSCTALAATAAIPAPPAQAGSLGPPGYPVLLADIPFGDNSYYLQPWRPMVATRTLAAYVGGFGIQNNDSTAPQSLAVLASCGFTGLRVGIPWGAFDHADPTALRDDIAPTLVPYLQAAQAAGMRPLILLQAFDQAPCPYLSTLVTLTAPLDASDTVMSLSKVDAMVPGLSGPSYRLSGLIAVPIDIAASRMCPIFFTGFVGNLATLSKQAGFSAPAGTMLLVNTLAAKPFSVIGTPDYETTMVAWLGYVDAVSEVVASILGTTGAADLGFDLEIWNELGFGSAFLDIDNYYADPIVYASPTGFPLTATDLVARTAAHAGAHPALYAGVRLCDGFSSITPDPASSTEPARVSALTKHFYPSLTSFPASNFGVATLDIAGNPTPFIPTMTLFTHEAAASAVSPYSLARDVSTETNLTGTILRGQNARIVDGAVAPVSVWMTETGTGAALVGVTGADAIARVQAKGLLRSLFFNIGIGMERVYAFQGVGDTTAFGMVDPAAPTTLTLPLLSLKRAIGFMTGGNAVANFTGALGVFGIEVQIAYAAPLTLFAGDGTAACPNAVQPSDFVVLPIQVSATRIAFLYYFIGTDMRADMKPATLLVRLTGLSSAAATLTAYDPVADTSLESRLLASYGATTLLLLDGATDYPCIAVFDRSHSRGVGVTADGLGRAVRSRPGGAA